MNEALSKQAEEMVENLSKLKLRPDNEKLTLFKKYLERNIEIWEKEKERIKSLLWWDEVSKQLAEKQAKQAQVAENLKTDSVPGATPLVELPEIKRQPLPTLSPKGHAWFMHPVGINEFISKKQGWANSSFAFLLGKVESNNDYSAYNKTQPKLMSYFNTNLISMKISEVMEKQQKREMFAVGRFQMIPGTLKAAVVSLKLDISVPYDEKIQNIIFEEYLIKIKRKQIIEFLESDGSVEDAIYAWAKEFASAGVRKGKTISGGRIADFEGASYYQGDGLNSAHILPDEMVKVLIESKNNR